MRVSRYAVTRVADDNTQWRMTLKARLVSWDGREEEDRSGLTRQVFEEYGGIGEWRMGGKGTKRGSRKREEQEVCGRMGPGGLAAGVIYLD